MLSDKQVSKEQIEQARKLDLLSYLQQYEPHELVKVASGVYSTRSNDSLKISNGKWYRWSRGYGGVSALDYLVKVREMGFVSAVRYLCDKMGYAPPPPVYTAKPPTKKSLLASCKCGQRTGDLLSSCAGIVAGTAQNVH